ncbi:MAG: transposase [Alphaproteobacteria bacterium]|nr:transposase [Alphaproteobacteria bacterium]
MAFKARVAKEALRADKTVQQVAAKHAVHPNQVSQWKRKASEGLRAVRQLDAGVRVAC